jgi:chemotaxis protein methyltransferase CheR
MNNSEYEIIVKYVYEICGIALGTGKEYLVNQRLEPIAREFGCENLSTLAVHLANKGEDSVMREKIVVAITTNETSFFRDTTPFEDFGKHILPKLTEIAADRAKRAIVRKGNKISIWSAASSTGQEAYTLAMQINEYLGSGKKGITPQDFLITGTDISSRVLAKAMAGEFTKLEIGRGLSPERRGVHFEEVGDTWIAKPHLRNIVEFRQLNLMKNFKHLGGFDIIFCRNVLIYFDVETKKKILDQMFEMLTPEGILILGSVENIYGISDLFESFSCGKSIFYKKRCHNIM